MTPSISIVFISSTHAAADDHQRFHARDRVDVAYGNRVDSIHGTSESSEHVEIEAADLAQLLRRAYLCGIGDAGGDVGQALKAIEAEAKERLQRLAGETVDDLPIAGEAVSPDSGSSTILSLADLAEDGLELGV